MFQITDLGKAIVGPSHRVLGRLSRINEECFRVTTDGGEIWLDNKAVWSVDYQITIICEPGDVHRYLCPEPLGDKATSDSVVSGSAIEREEHSGPSPDLQVLSALSPLPGRGRLYRRLCAAIEAPVRKGGAERFPMVGFGTASGVRTRRDARI